jgi:hypothetical protein
MDYSKIRTYPRSPKKPIKSKRKFTKVAIIIIVLVALILVASASAMSNDSSRIEPVEDVKTVKVTATKKEAVKPPENKSVETPAIVEPVVPVVDPNNCEAQGMWYRADNNECITKIAPVVEPAPAPVITSAPQTYSTGSGDCSLVNNYDWPTATAMRVCMQESGGNPNNKNTRDYHSFADCWGSFGLMQINCSHGEVYDGAQNMAIAYSMWKGAGNTFTKHWPNTCKKVGC